MIRLSSYSLPQTEAGHTPRVSEGEADRRVAGATEHILETDKHPCDYGFTQFRLVSQYDSVPTLVLSGFQDCELEPELPTIQSLCRH